MQTSTFDFALPADLIAQHPAEPRDRARLMVVERRTGRWEHRTFADLPDYPVRATCWSATTPECFPPA